MKPHVRLSFLILLLTLGLAACQTAQHDTTADVALVEDISPELAGFHPDSLSLIADHLQTAIDSQWTLGGVALVAAQGKVVYHEALGFSDQEKTDSLQLDDIFRMASMTKPVTTVAVMQLVEQGKLSVEDPVSQYIPTFSDPEVLLTVNDEDSTYTARDADREITIHHLLTHTSGLAYGVFDPTAGPVYAKSGVEEGWTKKPVTLADNIPIMGDLPLMHDPGEGWTYSTSIDVLGRVVEVVSEQPLDAYFQEHIFEPLGMDDTYFFLPDAKTDRLVDVYHPDSFDPSQLPETAREDYPIAGAKTYFPGGAGLSSTALDYFLFCDAIRQGGVRNGARILKEETVDLMTENRIDSLWAYEGVKFGYGFSIQETEGYLDRLQGRYGWGGYWQTTFWIDPQRDVIGILLTNSWPSSTGNQIRDGYEHIVNQAVVDPAVSMVAAGE